jgi:ABC-type amino acid transport substrate-binding protein
VINLAEVTGMRQRGGVTGHVAKAIPVVLVTLLVAAAIPTSGQQASYRLVKPGFLTVATYSSTPPAIIVGPGDQLGGLDGALLTAFARDHGLKLSLYQTTFASVILAVEQGKVDVGTYYYYTSERAKHVYYTYPFLRERASVITLKSFPYTDVDSLKGKRVGGVVGHVWAPYLQKAFGSNAVLFPNGVNVATALLNGQVDAYVNSTVVLQAAPINNSPDVVAHLFKPGDLGMPDSVLSTQDYNFVNCENRGLADALNEQMKKLHETGEWAKVLEQNRLDPANDVPLEAPPQLCP